MLEEGRFGGGREPLIDGQYGVVAVPGRPQGSQEGRPSREVDCDQFEHGR
jgi:hypothetical protein